VALLVPRERCVEQTPDQQVRDPATHADGDVALEDAPWTVQGPASDGRCEDRGDPLGGGAEGRDAADLQRVDGLRGQPGQRQPHELRGDQQCCRTEQRAAGAG